MRKRSSCSIRSLLSRVFPKSLYPLDISLFVQSSLYPPCIGTNLLCYKIFESRADLDSAIATRNPQVLADALIKIGYKRIQLERTLPIHIINGLRWNSHLPVSFRVRRLRRLDSVNKIKHHSSYRSKTAYVNWWKACAASSDL